MAIERWGALSVADHNDVPALVANVLLYDRLIMPMYTESDDRDERAYWETMGWDPDGQLARREQLGELVIECAWDKNRRQAYSDRYKAAIQLNAEANGEMVTRWLLTEDEDYQLPQGVNHTDVFVAYNSKQSTQEGIPYTNAELGGLNEDSRIGVLIAHELGVPDIDNPEVALSEAISLSKESEFRNKRADLYDFQMMCLYRGMSAKAVVAELCDRNREIFEYLKKQHIPVRKKAGFMLAQTLVKIIGGAFINPFAAIGELFSICQFSTIEAEPNMQLPNRLAPVAVFHDIEEKLGLNL
jgi:hypothetical protein